jgi:hypothetical protein
MRNNWTETNITELLHVRCKSEFFIRFYVVQHTDAINAWLFSLCPTTATS